MKIWDSIAEAQRMRVHSELIEYGNKLEFLILNTKAK